MEPTVTVPPVTPAPSTPAKKSNATTIITVIVAAVLSLCCCLPGVYNIIFPLPVETTTTWLGETTTESGTMPVWYSLFCICAAVIPWLVVGIIALVRRNKK